jgi:uncharacterized membrane protein YraQ (UPF0718 family)
MSIFHQITSLLKNKRFLLTLLVLLGVAAYFWSQSRYPQLDHKALMGAETQFEAIGFDTLLPMPENAGLVRRIYVNSANWMWTNRKGMTFGVIFGAVLMTMLPFLNGLKFRSRFANSLLGIVMGSPLGLCVNCSTPVAHGLYAAGARPETMLAAMVSSPTLNVVVLTMLFALFPPWLAFLKIGTTVIFILVIIPLIMRLFEPLNPVKPFQPDFINSAVDQKLLETTCATATEQCEELGTAETWLDSVRWLFRNFFLNLWYLIKITVPLMILAGVLGAALVTIIPLESLVGNLPEGRLMSWFSLTLLAIIGLLLPVPMTFDVIAIAVLYNAGMPVKYVMVLLFTLGVFSVYPFMTLWRSMSRQVAVSLFAALVVLGVASGIVANRYHRWDLVRQQELILEPFTKNALPPDKPQIDRMTQGVPADELLPELESAALRPELIGEVNGLSVSRINFNSPRPAESADASLMRRYDQNEFGITEHENYSLLKLDFRYSVARGIASGDVNRDGWSDFVVTSDAGVALYLNRQGKSFIQQRIEIPQLNDLMVSSAALVDLNNDGWLDLWFTTLRRGNYVIYSREGRFLPENLAEIPNQPDAVLTGSTAFGDLDRDGKLDIILGNVSAVGKPDSGASYRSARNVWLHQEANGFLMKPLAGMDGESLTSLLSDINGDGNPDLLIGNDMVAPDMIYLGDGKGGLKLVTKADNLIPQTTNFTMSISSADLDNDLKPEIHFGSVALRDAPGQKGQARRLKPAEICAELTDAGQRTRCEQFYNFREITGHAMSPGEIWECNNLPTQGERDACIAYKVMQNATVDAKNEKLCGSLPASWEYLSFICHSHFAASSPVNKQEMEQGIPQRPKTNVLLKRNDAGGFEDAGKPFGLNESGWSWNAKFADLDNDGWQDLFVVNGWVRRMRTESNYFYRNAQGKGFADMTEESGLTSSLNTLSYTYTDIDNDGDLDIIVVPTVGPLSIYINQTKPKQSIAFELRDGLGNYYGIGSKIIINYGDGQHQMRELQASGGYLSFDAATAYFGLGDEQTVKSVEIEWSTGEKSVLNMEFKAGARYVISRRR